MASHYVFQGNPLEAEDYCTVNKLELVIPESARDNSELLGISDVIDLMVEVAVSEGWNIYRLGVEFKDKHGQVHPLSVSVFWSEYEVDSNGKPLRNHAGFIHYHVQVSLAPLRKDDNLMLLGEFLLNPVIAATN